MIEVITFADIILRLPSEDNYKDYITNHLQSLKPKIRTEEILSISKPHKNEENWAIESNILAQFILNIPEREPGLRVQAYVDDIIPFLKRHIPKCNEVLSTKVVQLKRSLEDER
ncbi:hypothetical protein PU629_20410 [Pullulanibacillus sp. KACC 23026]|uniref:hypothetical protein n=1 Tax=Pullulanibacillus sp. KACC 23026 TaxID=3028315 RepID=UPI0023B046AE|nr:hypothetical protein [Pullulanibacillus sp. KACC 23026]WEG12432.1 hypothetical protein PU629_20410 [Pullulanibacillus sp. KACC 23026]